MKNRFAFGVSAGISLLLALFTRFGVGCYARLFVFMIEQIEGAWIVGAGFFISVKLVQMAPLIYRLGGLRGVRPEWLVFAALVSAAIDITVTLKAYPWLDKGDLDILAVMLSIGIIGWAGLVRLLVLQWLPDQPLVIPPFVPVVDPERPRSYQSQSTNLNPFRQPQSVERTVSQVASEGGQPVPSDNQFVSQLIPRVSSLFVVGLSGSGKDFTTSVLADYCRQKHNAKIFYIDPKKSDNEANLWESVADYSYSFKGVPMAPDEYLEHLKTAFSQYMDRLDENGGEFYTILVLNELATCATKVDNSKDKKWLAATLQPMISGLDSEGGAVWVLTQTTSMPAGFSNGVVSQFQKVIICRENQIENLTTQNQNTLMKGVNLDAVRSRCKESEIDRAIYSSSLVKWLSLPALRKGQSYYDRDARRWVGTPPHESGGDLRRSVDGVENSGNRADLGDLPQFTAPQRIQQNAYNPVTSTDAANAPLIDTLDDLILDYFAAVKLPQPKSLRDIKYSSRIRSTDSSDLAIQSALDRLVQTESLATQKGLWGFPEWFSLSN